MRHTTWQQIRQYVGNDTVVLDRDGRQWVRANVRNALKPAAGGGRPWWVEDGDIVLLPEPPLPEPLEFEYATDLYAAIRADASSVEVGWPAGDVWLLYGESVPHSWSAMWAMFGESLRDAVRLVPVAEDLPKRNRWPTVRRQAAER